MENNISRIPQSTAIFSEETEQKSVTPQKKSLPMILGGLTLLLVGFGGGYYLGIQQVQPTSIQTVTIPSPDVTSNQQDVVTTTPVISEESWHRKEYTSNGQTVWNILQPVQTESNENGLMEGYLSINSVDNGNDLMAEFSYPVFEAEMPQTLDEYAQNFTTSLGDSFTNITIYDIAHPQGVEMKMIRTLSLYPDGGKAESMPMNFILIWKHQDNNGKNVNPSLISIKPVGKPDMDSAIVNAFSIKLATGIVF